MMHVKLSSIRSETEETAIENRKVIVRCEKSTGADNKLDGKIECND